MRREGGKKGQQSERYQKLQIRINLFRSMVSLLSFPQIKQSVASSTKTSPVITVEKSNVAPAECTVG